MGILVNIVLMPELIHVQPILKAMESRVGIAGCYEGMCDAFRNSTQWQFMTDCQWTAK